jgi:predicted nucleic acid-binding protein
MTRSLVIDACCTLNMLATRIEIEIVQACDLSFLISDKAHGEALFLHTAPDADGLRTKEPASTERLRDARRLEIRPLDTTELQDAFVECAAQLRDEDASCVALAGVLGLPLMTDDGKERRVATTIFPKIDVVSTLAVVSDAAKLLSLTDNALLRVVTDLRWRGNFAPPKKDPLSSWYADLLRKAGVPG